MHSHRSDRIVLITPGQPSSNPRLVKEAAALFEAGYKVTVLYCFWADWARRYDDEIKTRLPGVEWIELGGNPHTSPLLYALTRLRHKSFRSLSTLFPASRSLAARAQARAFAELLRAAKRKKAALYIAHNLGALAVAAMAAAKNQSFYAFDAEDFHRGQETLNSRGYKAIQKLEQFFLRDASYISAASPLIADQYGVLYGRKLPTINNVTTTYVRENEVGVNNKLTLFWFSQTIGPGRGLEDILDALKQLPTEGYSLTLLGSISPERKLYFERLAAISEKKKVTLQFIEPIPPDAIIEVSASFDIGLALEPGRDENNRIALSNKIFTYLAAGNAVLFTSTPAQKLFFDENPGIGSLYAAGNVSELIRLLQFYRGNPQVLMEQKKEALRLAREKYNWTNEKSKFLSLVKTVLNP